MTFTEKEHWNRLVAERNDLSERLRDRDKQLGPYLRHLKACKINPGGPIMKALGDPEVRSCSCGLDALLSETP